MTQNTDLVAEELLAEKIDVVLVLLNSDDLKSAVKKINLDRANLVAIVTDGYGKKNFSVGGQKIPVTKFATIHSTMSKYKKIFWLISGGANSDNLRKLKNFFMAGGVPENNIRYFDTEPQISETWLANLRHVEEYGANFFITGNEYTQAGVNLNLIPTVTGGGVNLSDTSQTLWQSYLTAKHVFKHAKPSTIKFVLIGLMPHSLRYNNAQIFLNTTQNLQYASFFNEPTADEEFLLNLLKVNFKKLFKTVTAEQADINFDNLRTLRRRELSAKSITDFKDTTNFFAPDSDNDNSQVLKDYVVLKKYIELCRDNGAKPIGVILPFAPIVRKNFDSKLLISFREMIHQLEESYDFICVDMFELNISYDCFHDMTHLNEIGQSFTNSIIALKLWQMKFIPTESFCEMNYDYFSRLARRAPKEEYNELFENVLNISVQRIRRKEKIKVGFALLEAAQWCGDDLYNLLVRDKRFEITIFLSMNFQPDMNELTRKDFLRGVEQFKSHGLNVVALPEKNSTIPTQDLLIYLTPYINYSTISFKLPNITAKTLLAHIFYALDSSIHEKIFYNSYMFLVLWRMYFSSTVQREVFETNSIIDMPRGYYSGYPRMDIFFKKGVHFHFNWKMARPNAKKIIYAPHHSIEGKAVTYSTFHWNYQFMYAFAKAHPEISWVVKPHPWLLYKAVRYKVFPSAEAFNEYLQAWNDLPNAQVYTGAYYQNIFATSDGMILDCGSFKAEYQYVDKPMIYLTRAEQCYNEQGNKILEASYCVDGQDLNAIAATMQRVFIEGDDFKATKRREVFDEYLNYPKANGMLASEFIYKNITEGLMG